MTTNTATAVALSTLRAHLERAGVTVLGELRASLITGGRSNLTFLVTDGASRWVLRRPPTGGLTPSAHDVAREFRVIAALQGSGVPVAPSVLLCEDPAVLGAPFSLVDYVHGRSVQTKDDVDALSDRAVAHCVNDMVHVLARLHDVDHAAVGLGDLGRPDGYLERQVSVWARQWQRVKTGDLVDLDRLHTRLEASLPQESGAAVVHGDYRIDNTLLRPDHSIGAVVDWEMSTIGDPLADAALMCAYREPALDLALGGPAAWTSPRLPSPDELAQEYATASGRELRHWGFYLGLAHFKVAVIAQGIHHRFLAGATIGEGFDRAGEAAPAFVAAGLHAMRSNDA